ncbi:hypothetical protein KBC80_02860 [Candidatus Woesebacteria bacterium]|nr:hypothetical protein [Candidatus Woesebacteria bacterium]
MQRREIEKKPRFITRLDVFILLAVLGLFLTAGIVVKYVFQKEYFVTVELLATGGEWWWGVPPPYYWNSQTINPGAKELDVSRKPLVEVLDVEKYGHDDRKFMWVKARVKITKNTRTGAMYFKQFPLNIGETITIKPNSTMIVGNVVGIEGVKSYWNESERIIHARLRLQMPWVADAITVGDVMKNNKGVTIAEIVDKKVENAEIITTDWRGEPLHKRDPLQKDITLAIKMRVLKDGNFEYFNFNQNIQTDQRVKIQFQNITIEPTVLTVE